MSSVFDSSSWFSLRDLPLPVKVVLTCFLLAVGAGYSAAMVQLHMQDSKSGEMMPTVHDVILKFTGKKWFETDPPRPVSKFEKLITAPEAQTFGSNGSMAPAFFAKDDDGSYNKAAKTSESELKRVRAEREGEQKVLAVWASVAPETREKAYQDDRFVLDAAAIPAAITPKFKSGNDAVLVKSIIDNRCARCHGKDGPQSAFPLENYQQISKYLTVPATVTVKAGGDWVKVEEPIGLEKLTQSTHAHLLSFAMLFAMTGLVFAFSSYPTLLRCILGPWVLLAVVADVSLWWLARLSNDWGPYFAMAVIGSGGAAGAGLAAQIALSLWNMYGIKGRLVLILIFAILGSCGALVYLNQVKPGLEKKQNTLNAKVETEKKSVESTSNEVNKNSEPKPNGAGNPVNVKVEPEKKAEDPKTRPVLNSDKDPNNKVDPKSTVTGKTVGLSPMEKVLRLPAHDAAGKELALQDIPWKGDQEGGMVRAFFDKDPVYKKSMKDKDLTIAEKDKLMAERQNELTALTDWVRLAEGERRKSYEADALNLPVALAGKSFTTDYLVAGKVKIKTLIADRCYRCHQSGSDAEKYPFETYEQILAELQPPKP